MFTFLIFVIWLIAWGSCGGFCAWLASEKNRDGTSWFFLGFIFGWIALIALAGSPILSEEGKTELAAKKKADDDERLTTPELEAVRAELSLQEKARKAADDEREKMLYERARAKMGISDEEK